MEFFTQGLWGELWQTMSSTPLIGHMTDSLDSGQTEADAFMTEFRQLIQVQSHLEMPGILVQLGCIQRT